MYLTDSYHNSQQKALALHSVQISPHTHTHSYHYHHPRPCIDHKAFLAQTTNYYATGSRAFPSHHITGPYLKTYEQGPVCGLFPPPGVGATGVPVGARVTLTVVAGKVVVTASPVTVLVGPVAVAVTVWNVVAI